MHYAMTHAVCLDDKQCYARDVAKRIGRCFMPRLLELR